MFELNHNEIFSMIISHYSAVGKVGVPLGKDIGWGSIPCEGVPLQ